MRKSLFFLILFFCSFTTIAQNTLQVIDTGNITRERWRDSLLRMDMNLVPTGFLLEYSLFGFDSSKYDGMGNDDDTIRNDGRIFELHNTLWYSKVNSNALIEITDTLFSKAFFENRNNHTIPLTFIYQKYNRIRQTALSEGLLTIAPDSVGILDVPGRTASPYDTLEIFAFAPFKTSITQFNTIPFTLPDDLFYMDGITNVEIDFDDGAGFRSLSKGGTVNIYYGTEGTKYLTAKITTTGGTRQAVCAIEYHRPATYTVPDYSLNIEVDPVYTSDAEYLDTGGMYRRDPIIPCDGGSFIGQLLCGLKPNANVVVENGCDAVFDKPIMIIEGFDPEGSLNIEELRTRFSERRFIATMRAYGYDFVFVDFTRNGTYIENNAKVLEAVINWVNQTKSGTHKSTVIGFSMGGLIARWCLKDMEDRGLTHNVENYFSYDAPHQGANIPLGMQYIFKEMVRDIPMLRFNKRLRKLSDAFNSPAARQMLVTYAAYNNGPFHWFPELYTLNPLREAFAERLVAKGYPQQTNNFGIALGRGNNTVSTKDAGNGMQFTPAQPFYPESQIFGGNILTILVNLHADGYAVPVNNNEATIAYYNFSGLTFRKIFGIPIGPLPILRIRRFDYTGQYPYADGQGSFEQTQTDFVLSWRSGLAGSPSTDAHDGHNFVATVSALDLQNQSYGAANLWQSANIFYNIDNQIQNAGQVGGNTLVTPSLSPFDAVMTSTSDCVSIGGCSAEGYFNEDGNFIFPTNNNQWNNYHNTSITFQTARFIERNILNTQPIDCAGGDGLCNSNPTISGAAVLCTSGQYQLNNVPSGITIEWSSTNGKFRISGGQGTPFVTISRISNGGDILNAKITNICGASLDIPLSLSVGAPDINDYDFLSSGPSCISHSNQQLSFGVGFDGVQGCSLNYDANITDVEWQIFCPNPYTMYQNAGVFNCTSPGVVENAGIKVAFSYPSNPYVITFRFRVKNTCGWSDWSVGNYKYIQKCSYLWKVIVSPNPANNSIDVALKVPSIEKKDELQIREIQITNQVGVVINKYKFKDAGNRKTLNISNLKPGLYFMRVFAGGQWQSVSFMKQ